MSENLEIKTERVDDIPIIVTQLQRMQVADKLNRHFPPHANWQGLSLGEVAEGWLTHILSEANHRLNHVESWATKRLSTLQACFHKPVRSLDFSDDRLAALLDYLSDDQPWQAFEQDLGQHLIRVYDLKPRQIRVDSTSTFGYTQLSEDGLFQFGHSKDHRPDLPQIKIKMSVLDPLGLPLTTSIVSGEKADDPLYVPEIKKVQAALGQKQVLFVGDCKMAALDTRAYLAKSGDYYLCPLSNLQAPLATLRELLAPVWKEQQLLTPIFRPNQAEQEAREGAAAQELEQIAEGYEVERQQTAQLEQQSWEWTERVLVVRSLKLAASQEQELQKRLTRALAELEKLRERKQGKVRFKELEPLQAAVERVIERHKVAGLLQVNYLQTESERPVRRYRDRAAGLKREVELDLGVRVDEKAMAEAIRELGWHLYVTNQSGEELSLSQAVLAYRSEYLIERGFGRLKGKPLSIRPLYLNSDNRVKGLVRLLTIGLRVLTLLEFKVREKLAERGEKLGGLYAGNPRRATARPTSEKLLGAFEHITLTRLMEGGQVRYHITGLSMVQHRILELLEFPTELFTKLAPNSYKPTLEISEP